MELKFNYRFHTTTPKMNLFPLNIPPQQPHHPPQTPMVNHH